MSSVKTAVLVALGVICLGAGVVWARSARHRLRLLRRIEDEGGDDAARTLAQVSFNKELHAAVLYGLLAVASVATAVTDDHRVAMVFALVGAPAVVSIAWARNSAREARMSGQRFELERRAEEALAQEGLAPKAWATRLAPEDLPDIAGFDIGRAYLAGSGLMAGDFYDVFRVSRHRVAAVIGDVAGHGIESSITAFQAKYLLRVFLRQFRDPAQALEELNAQMSAMGRNEEFISVCIVVFDTDAGTARVASAGHPAGFMWHQRDLHSLGATGPLLMLDPAADYFSREVPLERGDVVLLYTDGLAEARSGSEQFGEERVAQAIRRDPGVAPDVLCKTLLDAARDFSDGALSDDVALLALRRA